MLAWQTLEHSWQQAAKPLETDAAILGAEGGAVAVHWLGLGLGLAATASVEAQPEAVWFGAEIGTEAAMAAGAELGTATGPEGEQSAIARADVEADPEAESWVEAEPGA